MRSGPGVVLPWRCPSALGVQDQPLSRPDRNIPRVSSFQRVVIRDAIFKPSIGNTNTILRDLKSAMSLSMVIKRQTGVMKP